MVHHFMCGRLIVFRFYELSCTPSAVAACETGITVRSSDAMTASVRWKGTFSVRHYQLITACSEPELVVLNSRGAPPSNPRILQATSAESGVKLS